MNAEILWPTHSICIRPLSLKVPSIAANLYDRTCRTGFDAPGFCMVNVGQSIDSVAFRQLMVDLKQAMSAIHEYKTGHTLIYLSATRFDQQETTRPHLDGGPDESLLMLGYEPSKVDSELDISDYAKCAFDRDLSPKEFMARHNPMFQANYELLRPYTTPIPYFSQTDYRIVCINNSSAPFSQAQPTWQGTLHTATILNPDEAAQRIVNSTMIAPAPMGASDAISQSQQRAFITTPIVHRRDYNNPK